MYSFLSLPLRKLEHLRRRMGFREVCIHKQAGPLKLSVSVSLPQSPLLVHNHTLEEKPGQTHHEQGCGLTDETLWDRYFSSTHPLNLPFEIGNNIRFFFLAERE